MFIFKTYLTIYFVLLWMTAQDEASTQIPSPILTSTAVKLEMLNYKTTTGTLHNIKDINSVA